MGMGTRQRRKLYEMQARKMTAAQGRYDSVFPGSRWSFRQTWIRLMLGLALGALVVVPLFGHRSTFSAMIPDSVQRAAEWVESLPSWRDHRAIQRSPVHVVLGVLLLLPLVPAFLRKRPAIGLTKDSLSLVRRKRDKTVELRRAAVRLTHLGSVGSARDGYVRAAVVVREQGTDDQIVVAGPLRKGWLQHVESEATTGQDCFIENPDVMEDFVRLLAEGCKGVGNRAKALAPFGNARHASAEKP